MNPTILLTLLLTLTASAFEFTGKVVGVADGDTITVLHNKQQHKIRFQHIDCPASESASCPTPYASRHACSRTDATIFWTCIKIAKALKEFDGEE